MDGYIYIIKNDIDKHVYIGQTINTLNDRLKEHFSKSKRINSKFYKAIRLYGIEHFNISLLEKCDVSLLNNREKYYIKMYDSFHNGYNSTLGGFGTHIYELDETEVIELYKEHGIGFIADKYGCNKKVIKSILVRNNVDLREYQNEAISVVMLSKEYEPLHIFESKKEAWRWLILNYRDNMLDSEAYTYIKRACEFGNIAFGYKWMYLSDIDISNRESILDNASIQRYNKNNIVKKDKVITKRTNHGRSGRPGEKCFIVINGERKTFNSLKELAAFISSIDGTNITDDKKLRHKAYNIKQYIIKKINYRGFEVGMI